MLRTTLGLKDDLNSDTVSTEFNLNQFSYSKKLEISKKTLKDTNSSDKEYHRVIAPFG